MAEKILKVIAGAPDRPIRILDKEIQCFVLEDETRVVTRASVLRAIGRAPKAKGGRKYDEEFKLPVFLTANNLKPFISKELEENSKPVLFEYQGKSAIGHRADLLPQICEVFLDAQEAGALRENQSHIAKACKVLHRGFAKLGIIGLVDEATGYQAMRDERALATILEKYITKELQQWTRTFDIEFYKQIFRLKGWKAPAGVKRPGVIGRYTNDLVYERLAPGVLDELRKKNPMLPQGYRRNKHHQWFTPEHGHPKLREHLAAVIALMKSSSEWAHFQRLMNRIFPKLNATIEMPLDD
jgi:hypothetical protein